MNNLALYNRDVNVLGEIFEFTFSPEYGTTVSLNFEDNSFYAADYYRKPISKNLNHLMVSMDLKYTNRTENEARAFVGVLETLSTGRGTGKDDIPGYPFPQEQKYLLNFEDVYYPSGGVTGPRQPTRLKFPTGIYKHFSGLSVMSYNVNEHEGLFDFNLSLQTNREVPLTNWSGSSILSNNYTDFLGNKHIARYWTFSQGQDVKKFDIVYWPFGLTDEDENNDDYSNHFWYAVRGRAPGSLDATLQYHDDTFSPTDHMGRFDTYGNVSGLLWTNEFSLAFTPDDGVSFTQNGKTHNLKFSDSYLESQNLNRNKNLLDSLVLTFSNRSDKETRALIHFLEKKGHKKPFKVNLPQLYKRDKYFVVQSLSHEFVYKNNNTTTVNLKEVVQYRNFIDSRSELVLITEDGNQLATEIYTGSYLVPENNLPIPAVNLDVTNSSKKISLERSKAVRPISGQQYTDKFEKITTGFLTFHLNWTNVKGYFNAPQVEFNDGGPDLDLQVIDPQGNLHSSQTVSVFSTQPGFGFDDIGLYQSGVATGTFDRGEEVLFYRNQPSGGTYQVYALLYNNLGMDPLFDHIVGFGHHEHTVDYLGFSIFDWWSDSVANNNIISRYEYADYEIKAKISGVTQATFTGRFLLYGDYYEQHNIDTTGEIFTFNI